MKTNDSPNGWSQKNTLQEENVRKIPLTFDITKLKEWLTKMLQHGLCFALFLLSSASAKQSDHQLDGSHANQVIFLKSYPQTCKQSSQLILRAPRQFNNLFTSCITDTWPIVIRLSLQGTCNPAYFLRSAKSSTN